MGVAGAGCSLFGFLVGCIILHSGILFRMRFFGMNSHISHTKAIRAKLLAAMREGEYADCERLPRESVLCVRLGISRTQLRDILASLEREGFITRRHGVGTIINRHVLNVHTRMDIEVEFLDMIRQNGYTPAVAFIHASEEPADPKTASQLQLIPGTAVLRVSRLCTADGKPAVYCEDVFDKCLVQEPYTDEDFNPSIFHFLQQRCGVYPYLDLTDLRAIPADEKISEILKVEVGTPILYMEEIDYDIDGKPVFCSTEYFADGIFRHTVLRKKL